MAKNLILTPLSWIYKMAVTFRHRLFDWGVLKSERFDIPIICVGNITVGGTGKTPVTEMLVEHLRHNYRIALLSRGYGRRTSGYREAEVKTPFREVGDEPKQIKLKFPEITVAVCEKRSTGIRNIRSRHPEVNLIIMDDGFQHRYVEPKINVVLMDYSRPIQNDFMLPKGSLRDLPSALHRAHYVLVTKCPPTMNALDRRILIKVLNLYPYQRLYFTSMVTGAVVPLFPDAAPRKALRGGERVIAMAGVGNPAQFVENLSAKYEVVDRLIFRDHYPYRVRDMKMLETKLRNAPEGTLVVTTEKDAVKLTNRRSIPDRIVRSLYFEPIHVSFVDGDKYDFIKNIDKDVRKD